MRILFICYCLLFFPSLVYANGCTGKNAELIGQLEAKLDNCKIDMSDTATDVEMIKAYDDLTNCSKNVAYQLFDSFYKSKNESAKNDFDKVIEATYMHYQNLVQNSDLAQKLYTGTMYEIQVNTRASLKIKAIVQEYLREMKIQCADLSDLPDDFNTDKE